MPVKLRWQAPPFAGICHIYRAALHCQCTRPMDAACALGLRRPGCRANTSKPRPQVAAQSTRTDTVYNSVVVIRRIPPGLSPGYETPTDRLVNVLSSRGICRALQPAQKHNPQAASAGQSTHVRDGAAAIIMSHPPLLCGDSVTFLMTRETFNHYCTGNHHR